MSERLNKAEAAQGYFRSNHQPEKKPLVIAGVVATAALAAGSLTGCDSPEEVSSAPTSSPIPESTQPSATPEITPPVVEKNPHPDIPQIDDKYKTDWPTLRAFLLAEEEKIGGVWVENEEIKINVNVGGISEPLPQMRFKVIKPTSAEEAIAVKNKYYSKFCEEITPVIPENVVFYATSVNSGDMDPYGTIGLVDDKRAEFEKGECK